MRSQPVILGSASDKGRGLDRITAKTQEGRDEAWLQSVIFEHPELLPVAEFDESFAPAVPVGREISTSSGYIDNLYVSPSGSVTIIETKLWTNPERHRTVVAQIIDYAKELSQWNYDQLDAAILKASRRRDRGGAGSLGQLIAPFLEEVGMSEVDFQERIISTLRNGEFLLLIIGDQISPNLALLTESISGVPGLDFRLGLVELQLYRLDRDSEWPLLVIPEIVGRTVERTRGVIKVQYVQERPKLEIDIESDNDTSEPRGKTTKQVFLSKAPEDLADAYGNWLDVWQEKDVVLYWGVEGFSARVDVDGKLETAVEAYPEWAISIVRKKDKERLRLADDVYRTYTYAIRSVGKASEILLSGKKFVKHEFLTSEDLITILQASDHLVDYLLDQEGR